eukprot:TRINITY_DN16340_c0_g1_i2.p1 TRINITY_DN16340_c0_g1~~TRINITY_DN16340_c0_g1_i2.p1  ORF type:complete len:104 (-),score=15.82 TRINITY_DN16340_c0_g1_i2:21-332(-)
MCIRDRVSADGLRPGTSLCQQGAAWTHWEPTAGNTVNLQHLGTMACTQVSTTQHTHDQPDSIMTVSYTHLRAHETPEHLVCRLLLEKKKKKQKASKTCNVKKR